LRSSNPKDHPKIIPNYFSDPEDLKPFKAAFEFGRNLAAALTKYNATIFDKPDPVCIGKGYDQGTNFRI